MHVLVNRCIKGGFRMSDYSDKTKKKEVSICFGDSCEPDSPLTLALFLAVVVAMPLAVLQKQLNQLNPKFWNITYNVGGQNFTLKMN